MAVSAALLTASASAQQLEQIEIIGSQTDIIVTDVVTSTSLLDEISPTQAFATGGLGGFAGFTERGTTANHTVVYRNGVPVNDAGAGWYDFGHDVATGNEGVRVVSGPHGALFGTASMGGTVFITDNIKRGAVLKYGDDFTVFSSSPTSYTNFTFTDVSNGSVRNDNEELDFYVNKTARIQTGEFGYNFVLNYAYSEYDYDYDDCYDESWNSSNNCVQQGTRHTLSIRNDYFTFGYNSNDAEYYTGDYLSYESKAENYYFDARKSFVYDRNISLIAGVTASREEYMDNSRNSVETYALINYQDWMDLAFRQTPDTSVTRIGLTDNGFTLTASTSYRNPNLYELNGDGAWVFANENLDPEQGKGVEFGYAGLTLFKYSFSEGIDFDYGTSTYVNTDEYQTQGVRYTDTFDVLGGDLTVFAGYTDTDQPQAPKRKGMVSYTRELGNFTVSSHYTAQQERGVDYTGTQLEDFETVDLFVTYDYSPVIDITVSVEDAFDKQFEVAPGYDAGGREINLTITYR